MKETVAAMHYSFICFAHTISLYVDVENSEVVHLPFFYGTCGTHSDLVQ